MKKLSDSRVGDIVRSRNGVLRMVRHNSGRYITFAIRHCSWTGRPYTVYSVSELESMGYVNTGINVKIKLPIERRIFAAIKDSSNRSLSCCDVRGTI